MLLALGGGEEGASGPQQLGILQLSLWVRESLPGLEAMGLSPRDSCCSIGDSR